MNVIVAPAARTGVQPLPDDRLLGWAEWGSPDGTPVLFSPAAATSRSLGFGPEAVDDLGIRLISLDRPGIGESTPHPGRGFGDFATDVAAFIELRELGPCGMVGTSQGAAFALACAAADAVSAVALAGGTDEIANERLSAVLPPGVRELVNLAVTHPAAAERAFAALGPETVWDMVLSNAFDGESEIYEEETFVAAYRSAVWEAFASGPEGYARDCLLAMGHWNIELSSIGVPVDVWYGEGDHRHSPDQGERLTERIPGAVRHLVPGAGGAVLWTHPEPILQQLTQRLS